MAHALLLCVVLCTLYGAVAAAKADAAASENPYEVANDPTHAHMYCDEGAFWKTLHQKNYDPHSPKSCSEVVGMVRIAKDTNCEIALPPSLCDYVHAAKCKGVKCKPDFNQIDKWSQGNAPPGISSNPKFKLTKKAKQALYRNEETVAAYGEIVAVKKDLKHDADEDPEQLKENREKYYSDLKKWTELPKANKEEKVSALLTGKWKGQKFEASGVCVRDNLMYVVFDNMQGVARLSTDVNREDAKTNVFFGREEDSQHEAIACREGSDILYTVVETKEHEETGDFHVAIREYDANTLKVIQENFTDAEVEKENTGVEGMTLLTYHDQKTGVYTDYLLALCEGNDCFYKDDKRTGQGVVHVLRKHDQRPHGGHKKDITHDWEVIKTLSLPREANFMDYSDIDIDPVTGRVGVVSQESSAVWVGHFNFTEMDFMGKGEVFRFPTDHGAVEYCNIEGFAWLDGDRFVAVSDKPKRNQARRCKSKGQSVHIFTLPKESKE